LSRYAEEQWPNLVAYSRFCDDCVTSEEECATRQLERATSCIEVKTQNGVSRTDSWIGF
ncbi:unnamed protein product, partial [Auanema sp. JU1783]